MKTRTPKPDSTVVTADYATFLVRSLLAMPLLLAVACSSNTPAPAISEPTQGTNAPVTETPSMETPDIGSAEKDLTSVSCDAEAADVQASLLALINEARATARNCGDVSYAAVPPLRTDSRLQSAAGNHSVDMVQNNFFDHTGSDGMSASDRIAAATYPWAATGENIAAGQPGSSDAVQAWIASDGHCANLMQPHFKDFGAACEPGNGNTDFGAYWTAKFAATR